MQKKVRLILCLLFIVLVAGVTVWRSCSRYDAEETGAEGKACQNSIVTICCEHGAGNAVLMCEKEGSYVLCTAGHVLQGLAGLQAEEIQMQVADNSVKANSFWSSDTYDVAFVEIEKNKYSEVLEGKQETGLSDAGYRNLKEDDLLWAWSYYGGELVSTEIKVNSPWILVEDFGYHMIWGTAKDTKGGMSGSGVFDCEGHLAGILCGGNESEVAVLPINIILGELKNSGIDISED